VESTCAWPPATALTQAVVALTSGFGVWVSQAVELLDFWVLDF
jgi:hypothetical protein